MGVKEVIFELIFKDYFFWWFKKMNEVKNFLKEVFENIIEYVKKDFCFGDIMRVVIYNDGLDLLVFVFFWFMEDMNVEVMMNCLENVFNSNEDILFDFFCWIDVGVIKYLWGGWGVKMVIIF